MRKRDTFTSNSARSAPGAAFTQPQGLPTQYFPKFTRTLLLLVAFFVVFSAGVFVDVASADNNAGAAFSIWPDTGQTRCYDDNNREITCPPLGQPFSGQDGCYQGPKRSYTKLGYGGVELPDSATQADGWIMTRDNVTGLIWEIKTDDGTIHDKDNQYTWCDHNSNTNGEYEGTCGDGNDTEDFINALNSANFGGYSDWRLPTVKELSTLVDSGHSIWDPAIDILYFPNTQSFDYWSSTTDAYDTYNAWYVDFYYGGVSDNYKYYDYYVRAVRSGQDRLLDNLVDNHDGTITDTTTGLMWQKCSMGQTYNPATYGCDGSANGYTWQEAMAECENLELAGYSDWRLPNRNELQSIVDYSRYNPAIEAAYFPYTECSWYWSSTTNAGYTCYAWLVNFGYLDYPDGGDVGNGSKSTDYSYVRAVRSGPSGLLGNLVITAPPKRLPPQQISQPPAGSTKAVVITHGWNSNADGWVLEMAEDICNSIKATQWYNDRHANDIMAVCSGNGWDVFIVDWRTIARDPNPIAVWVKAKYVGEILAIPLFYKHYEHVHLIAHSAGSNLIESASRQLKKMARESGRSIEIHETFLDAFDPVIVSDYGKWADWADNYVDTREVLLAPKIPDGTKWFLRNAYNIDVTSGVLELCGPTCRHDRPVRFYGKSISWDFVGDSSHAKHDSIESTDSVGFVLSLEAGHSMSSLNRNYPKGKKCIMKDSICYQDSLPPSVFHYLMAELKNVTVKAAKGTVNYIKGTGAKLFNSLKISLQKAVSSFAVPSMKGDMVAQGTGDVPTEEPAWIILKVTTEAPVDTLRFNWKFDKGGEGFLRIFVDNQLVREMDQRYLPLESTEAEEVYIGDANGTLPAGDHEIAFRLDGFSSNGTSGVELTDVELLQKEVSENVSDLGDVSGDGKINIVDALFVARYAVKLPVSNFNANAADVNCDGSVNIIDALLIARKSVGLPVPAWCGSGK